MHKHNSALVVFFDLDWVALSLQVVKAIARQDAALDDKTVRGDYFASKMEKFSTNHGTFCVDLESAWKWLAQAQDRNAGQTDLLTTNGLITGSFRRWNEDVQYKPNRTWRKINPQHVLKTHRQEEIRTNCWSFLSAADCRWAYLKAVSKSAVAQSHWLIEHRICLFLKQDEW